MGWSIGYDGNWKRDVGYGVPAICDQPGCGEEIDRGLGCVCGGDPYGGDHGCGLFFCGRHLFRAGRRGSDRRIHYPQLCERCAKRSKKGPFPPTPDTLVWLRHKLTDPSWGPWRAENPDQVIAMAKRLEASAVPAERTPESTFLHLPKGRV